MRFGAFNMSAIVVISAALALCATMFDCQANAASATEKKSASGDNAATKVGIKAGAKAETKDTPPVETKATHSKIETKTAKHTGSPAPRRMMVPPPPPEIPLISEPGMMERHLSTLGVPLDFMSKSDLESMRTRLQSNEERVRKETDDMKCAFQEKQDRVKRFEDLYQEGVVSRKELESAHRELTQAENDMRDQDEKMQDVITDLVRVNKQLAAIEVRDKRSAALRAPKRTH